MVGLPLLSVCNPDLCSFIIVIENGPGLGDEEYPGFPHDVCPEKCPDISHHNSIMTDVLKRDPGIRGRIGITFLGTCGIVGS